MKQLFSNYVGTIIIAGSIIISTTVSADNVCMIGTGYVGIISGAVLADHGHHITCVDIDQKKIDQLNNLVMPIYEPGVEELVRKNVAEERLFFSANVQQAIQDNDIIMIAVGTPMDDFGNADLSALKAVLKTVAQNLTGYKVICVKSTVPIGTHHMVHEIIRTYASAGASYDIVSNPEFLRQGSAINDFLHVNPIVIGSDSPNGYATMAQLYQPLVDTGIKIISTDLATAEAVKYAHNCFLATRICFVNELAQLCMASGADITKLIQIMAEGEAMYPTGKLRPGPGIGGSCLPKDTNAFVKNAKDFGVDLTLIQTAITSNIRQKEAIVTYIKKLLGNDLKNKKIALWGLSFKANTDDIRYSPAITIIERLLAAGAELQAYDPQAMKHMQELFPNVQYCATKYDALKDVDLLVIITEWNEFKEFNATIASQLMREKIIFDTRNILPATALRQRGFTVLNLGKRD